MQLEWLELVGFKNYKEAKIECAGKHVLLTGPNGAGKTNLLEALYYLCNGKGYFGQADSALYGEPLGYFTLAGKIIKGDKKHLLRIGLVKGRRKVIILDTVQYTRLADHYGVFPAIMVAPGDIELITGGSEGRRAWMDSTISVVDKDYLLNLIDYHKVLNQRNALLKLDNNSTSCHDLLDTYDEQLAPLGEALSKVRMGFVEEISKTLIDTYNLISPIQEVPELSLISQLSSQSMYLGLGNTRGVDLGLRRSTFGIHRDDLSMVLQGEPLKRFGSQGQQKTFLLALKLAEYNYIQEKRGISPFLLLDDICDRLDDERLQKLFSLVSSEKYGQIFYTDAHPQRVLHYLKSVGAEPINFNVSKGTITPALAL